MLCSAWKSCPFSPRPFYPPPPPLTSAAKLLIDFKTAKWLGFSGGITKMNTTWGTPLLLPPGSRLLLTAGQQCHRQRWDLLPRLPHLHTAQHWQ